MKSFLEKNYSSFLTLRYMIQNLEIFFIILVEFPQATLWSLAEFFYEDNGCQYSVQWKGEAKP